ncbi:MAG: sigma-54-dependent Fis family transcriptional regulator [Saprospiraceae bacterium]|nr:sigma-54-dependent Fis family transcriptional regulator [Saprospiraceae bacterium]
MAKILIVDDESSIRRVFRDILEHEKYTVDEAADGMDALAKIEKTKYDVIIMDIKMPKMDGLETLSKIQNISADVPVIMISGHADIETAVQAVKMGAFDFISKPLDLQRILITIRNAMEKLELNTEIKVLKRKVGQNKVQEIVGGSSAINKVKKEIDKVAPMDARVLITGPNGTGKELVARWVHAKSNRANRPLVEVNCAAIPSELIESELFGHMKGSFTGAVKDHPGKFEQAHGGTIFLDEIGDMSLSAQAKVLRALQEKKISRVGGDKEIDVDVRVIAATNKDLLHEIELGNFREDLYYRLAVVLIEVPALSKRKDDIPSLVEHFIKQICDEYGTAPVKVTKEANKLLQSVAWSGNIRELRNVVERMIIFCNKEIDDTLVREYVLPVAADGTGTNKLTLRDIIRKYDNFDDLVHYMEQEFNQVKKAPVLK